MADVAIVGGSEETRLLLRGLVRLHHHRVLSEGAGPEALSELPEEPASLVVLIDADIEKPEWAEPIRLALRDRPSRRAVLISPTRSPRIENRSKELGFATLLRRPFAVHELVEAIHVPVPNPPPSSVTPSTPSEPPI
ncbi:MAG: hypothetical protein L3K06_03670 [Thermoplasmata archaeon]|nr:hypothetical protein [Thermoplasmata archaeon]MCI4354444.1 hypothetical protein [Thermoplasmata archaeon]